METKARRNETDIGFLIKLKKRVVHDRIYAHKFSTQMIILTVLTVTPVQWILLSSIMKENLKFEILKVLQVGSDHLLAVTMISGASL